MQSRKAGNMTNDDISRLYKKYLIVLGPRARIALKDREFKLFVLKMAGKTYKEISELDGVTPERIRQIVCKAERKLRMQIKKLIQTSVQIAQKCKDLELE